MNNRAAIRLASKGLIIAAATAAGARVFTNRPNPLAADPSTHGGGIELPAVLIYTPTEDSEIFDESPRRYQRTLTMRVECVREVSAITAAIDDELDAFAGQVERALLRDPTLGDAVDDCELTGSVTTISDAGAGMIGAAVLTFAVSYFTEDPEPGAPALDDLESIHVDYDLAGQQAPADRAKTVIEGLET